MKRMCSNGRRRIFFIFWEGSIWWTRRMSGALSVSMRSGPRLARGSTVIVFVGIGLGWWLYGRKSMTRADETDVLERAQPDIFYLLRRKYFVDEAYEWSFVRLNAFWAKACAWLDL